MKIQEIVEQALKNGYLTPSMEAEVGKICETATELSVEEYMALDQLMGALLSGDIVAMPRKHFINVMEELVLSEALTRIAQIEATSDCALEVGDIAAYALNRLPPLYATTEEGANYQRQKAKEELKDLINQQVNDAINRYLNQPIFYPERQAIQSSQGKNVLQEVSSLLESYAPGFEND
jgi:uncharacterized protein (UPF0297 family)